MYQAGAGKITEIIAAISASRRCHELTPASYN